ncbi:TonB-dependent receptor [Shewanella sp. GXUN23E]|uniref:TonB-dependent receptor n=1 Tax=Shewanella sp. GXUN23E TaxID=3422498 RepID=UPI003D7D4D84
MGYNQSYKISTLSAAVLTLFGACQLPAYGADMEHMLVLGRTGDNALNMAADVTVIDAADIAQSGVTTVTEALRNISGIQVSDNNTNAVFAMRGFSSGQAANNTLILVDGRRLNNIDIAAPSLNAIPLNMIERVEILNGSAGVLYGDQAVGGVINIITRVPDRDGGSLTLSGGSFDTAEGRGDLAGQFVGNWHYYLSGNYRKSDNYRRHNASETGAVLGRIGYRDDTTDFYLESSYYDNDVQTPGGLTASEYAKDPRQSNATFANDYQHDVTRAVRSGVSQQISDNWLLAVDANYSDSQVTSILWGGAGRNDRRQLLVSPKAVASFPTRDGELSIVVGSDLSRGESAFDFGRSNTQTQLSTYVQATVPLTESLSYVVGGRYADVKDDLTDASVFPLGTELNQDAKAFELGLNWQLDDANKLYLRGEDNFRFAKVDEQAYTPPTVVGLKPQTGRSYEAGWRHSGNQLQSWVNLYRLDLDDEIIFDPTAQKPEGGSFDGANINAESSRRYGVGLGLDWQVLTDVQVGGEVQWVDAEFTAGVNRGKQLSWVARESGRVYASWDITEQWQLYSDLAYTGKRYEEGDNANAASELASYTLVNLAVNYRRGDWLASVRVDNLLDKDYVSAAYYAEAFPGYEPAKYYVGTGRNARLTLSYQF